MCNPISVSNFENNVLFTLSLSAKKVYNFKRQYKINLMSKNISENNQTWKKYAKMAGEKFYLTYYGDFMMRHLVETFF